MFRLATPVPAWRLPSFYPPFRTRWLFAKIPTNTSKMSSGSTSEETFEWIETPPARTPSKPEFDCGVRTTSVCTRVLNHPSKSAPRAIELHNHRGRG